jgi:hypothetical protein
MSASASRPNWFALKENRFVLVGILWFLAYWAARALLEGDNLSTWARVAAALGPIPIFAWFVVSFIGAIRGMDELERRIHLEALAIAFPLGIVLLQTLALLQRAVTLKFEDWSYAHVWIYLPIFYFISLGLVRKRYQ